MTRPLPAMAVLFLALVPACAAPQDFGTSSSTPHRARLALALFEDETGRGAGPLAEGLRLFLEEALSRQPTVHLVRRPDDQADLILRGTVLDFRPPAGSDPPVLVTELGLLDTRNGGLLTSRIVTSNDRRGPEKQTAVPEPLRHWAGTATENLLRVWLASAIAMLREAVPSGYFVYDAAGKPVAPLPPPPPRRQRPAASDLPPAAARPTATVTAGRVDVREGSGPRFPVLGHLTQGKGCWSSTSAATGATSGCRTDWRAGSLANFCCPRGCFLSEAHGGDPANRNRRIAVTTSGSCRRRRAGPRPPGVKGTGCFSKVSRKSSLSPLPFTNPSAKSRWDPPPLRGPWGGIRRHPDLLSHNVCRLY